MPDFKTLGNNNKELMMFGQPKNDPGFLRFGCQGKKYALHKIGKMGLT